jgi:hypothetical protein
MAVEYREGPGGHHFRVKSANGQILAHSEGYVSDSNAKRGYHALLDAVHGDVLAHLRAGTIVESDESKAAYTGPRAYTVRELLLTMFNGWKLREESWVPGREGTTLGMTMGSYARNETECMIEAAGGDVLLGMLLSLFDHWGNDIMSIAAHYGLAFKNNGDGTCSIREDVPPAPSPLHWWDDENQRWAEPLDPDADMEAGLVPTDGASVAPVVLAAATVSAAQAAVDVDKRRGRK